MRRRYRFGGVLRDRVAMTTGTTTGPAIGSGGGGGGGSITGPVDLGAATAGAAANAVRTLETSVLAGRCIIVTAINATATAPTVTDSAGNTYTKVISAVNGTTHSTHIFVALNVVPLATGSTITVSPGRSDVGTAMSASAWQNIAATNAVSGSLAADGGGTATTSPNTGLFAVTSPPQLLFGVVGMTSPSRTFTPNSGWSLFRKDVIPSDFIRASASFYGLAGVAGNYNPGGTLDTSTTWAAAVIALKQA